MTQTHGRPYHPQTQGKIERYHRTMKNVVKLSKYYFPWELDAAIGGFVYTYNNERYHESLDNVRPVDVYEGRSREILEKRAATKRATMRDRKKKNLTRSSVKTSQKNISSSTKSSLSSHV